MTTIDALRWWHVAQCAELERSAFPGTAWSPETFWSELAHESRHYLVALADTGASGEPVVIGYAGLACVSPEADVQTIVVAPEARGLGIGADLLDRLLGHAQAAGCTSVMLEVAAGNEPALALYEGRGFERISVRRDYYGPGRDAIVMRRRPG